MHAKAPAPDSPEDTEPDSATVLLVDDQPVIALVLRKILTADPNLTFYSCTEATEALALARRCRPTVILQDLDMPGANGLDLVMAYRSTPGLHNVPIVVLSSNEEPDMKRAAFAIGANDYLVKPPEPIELIARVRYHSRSYLSLVRLDAALRAIRESQAQLLKSNTDLQRLTNSDGLTGLPNRRYFNEYLSQAWNQSTRDATPLSLLMIDVDYFKRYNDRFGHLAGDEALRKVAAAIRATLDESVSLGARFGGEEFSVVLPRCDAAAARAVSERIRRQVEATVLNNDSALPDQGVTVSIGAATMVATAEQVAINLIAAADSRLYRAKCDGRNRVVDA